MIAKSPFLDQEDVAERIALIFELRPEMGRETQTFWRHEPTKSDCEVVPVKYVAAAKYEAVLCNADLLYYPDP